MNKGLYTSNTPEWATPHWLYNQLNHEFDFVLDPCCNSYNCKCEYGFKNDEGADGLSESWSKFLKDKRNKNVFMNPPYGRQIESWVEKAFIEGSLGCVVVALLPARTDTNWFHTYIYKKFEIRFLKGRINFNDGKQGAPFPSMIVIFRDNQRFV